MISGRLKTILLASLIAAFVTMPLALAQQRQRRVFTNDDISRAAPPPAPAAAAPAAPAATPAAPAAGTPSGEAAPTAPQATPAEGAAAAANPPRGVALAESLQGALRQYITELSEKLDQAVDASRQERWRNMMNLTMQFMAQNQLYIAELQAQQPQEGEAPSSSQPQPAAGSQP